MLDVSSIDRVLNQYFELERVTQTSGTGPIVRFSSTPKNEKSLAVLFWWWPCRWS
jgi:hypothetical protein